MAYGNSPKSGNKTSNSKSYDYGSKDQMKAAKGKIVDGKPLGFRQTYKQTGECEG